MVRHWRVVCPEKTYAWRGEGNIGLHSRKRVGIAKQTGKRIKKLKKLYHSAATEDHQFTGQRGTNGTLLCRSRGGNV